jgi:hypothetical protein
MIEHSYTHTHSTLIRARAINNGGRIVRTNYPICGRSGSPDTNEVTINEHYLQALRDWVDNWLKNIYVQGDVAIRSHMTDTMENIHAMVYCLLGSFTS